jgi:predicted nucleotide-binding protein (sugar kinase/HSP70/actin superfamily)
VPVISLNAGGMEKNSGFKLSIPMLRQSAAIIVYGDILMLLKNQVKPYEANQGETDTLVDKWVNEIALQLEMMRGIQLAELKSNLKEIVTSFENIKRVDTEKTKVGIVGEIYVKYSGLGNNNLEEFLMSEGCEVMVPGLLGFLMYCMENGVIDYQLYGGSFFKSFFLGKVNEYLGKMEELIIDAVKTYSSFVAPSPFIHMKELVKDIIGLGCKMGEGWFLPAEMVELINNGYGNIVVTQPFGCLPNHIVGKGVVANIKSKYPEANIVPIDYDPGATRVNQENRIKLMLAVAREKFIPEVSNEEEELQLGFQNWVLML